MNSPQQKLQLEKIVHLGKGKQGQIYAKIRITGDGNLSISGVEGPLKNGDATGDCGQIIMSYKEYDERGYTSIAEIHPAHGWTHELIKKFFDVWNQWHLNDMRAGCEHQRKEKWNERPIDPTQPLTSFGKHVLGSHFTTWNMLTWVTRKEHPKGLLLFPCPTCGYKYGSDWLTEDLPGEVEEFLESLPSTDITPAWV